VCLLSNRTRKYKIGVPPVLLKLFFNLSFFLSGTFSSHIPVCVVDRNQEKLKKSQQRIQREPEDLGGNDGNEAGRNNSQGKNTHT
jgi:hypothetical protein